MDTCVLIPSEFSLVLSTDVLDLFEMRVGLWSNTNIRRGTEFLAEQGNVRLDKLEVYGMMKENDVRKQYGCVDQVEKHPDRQVRHCNWIRFLKASAQVDKINLLASKEVEKFVYRAVRDIPANTELIAAFEKDSELYREVLYFNRADENGDEVENMADESDIEVDEMNSSMEEDSRPHPVSVTMTTETGNDFPRTYSPPGVGNRQRQRTPPTAHQQNNKSYHRTPESPATLLSPMTPDSGRKSFSSGDSLTSVSDISPNSSNSSLIGQNDHVFTPPSSRGPMMVQRPAIVCVASPFKHVPIHNKYRLFERFDEDGKNLVGGEESVMSSSTSSASNSTSSSRTPVKRNRERTWLPCEICGKKFDRPSLLRRHIRTHTGEKPHACDICGKAFSTSSSLNTHRRIHSGEKPHQCRVCGKRFTASSNLYYHRMTHNKEKPHKCSLCSKSFPTPGDLKSHMYVHNGSWPYRCDVCDRGFSKQTNLKNHMLLHTGDKPHECSLCGKRFALQCNLRTHMKTHESDTQEECFKCGKIYLMTQQKLTNGYCDVCIVGQQHQQPSSSPSSAPHSPKSSNFHSISEMLRSGPDAAVKDAAGPYYNALTNPQWARGQMIMPLLGMSLSAGRYLNPALLQMSREAAKNGTNLTAQNYASMWMANGYRV